jgi:hypothetical protein
MGKRMTLQQCFNFLAANRVLLYVEKTSTTGRNHIVLTVSPRSVDGHCVSGGRCRTPADIEVPLEESLSLLCEAAKDEYEDLEDE